MNTDVRNNMVKALEDIEASMPSLIENIRVITEKAVERYNNNEISTLECALEIHEATSEWAWAHHLKNKYECNIKSCTP